MWVLAWGCLSCRVCRCCCTHATRKVARAMRWQRCRRPFAARCGDSAHACTLVDGPGLSLQPGALRCAVPRVAVVLLLALRMFSQQAVPQRVGLALQRGAVRRGRQCGNALVNGLRCVASELHMALFMVRQGAQV